MNGKYTILPVFYSNEVNIGSMGSETYVILSFRDV